MVFLQRKVATSVLNANKIKDNLQAKTTSGAGCQPVVRIDLQIKIARAKYLKTLHYVLYMFIIKLFTHIRDFVCKIFSKLRSGGETGQGEREDVES